MLSQKLPELFQLFSSNGKDLESPDASGQGDEMVRRQAKPVEAS